MPDKCPGAKLSDYVIQAFAKKVPSRSERL